MNNLVAKINQYFYVFIFFASVAFYYELLFVFDVKTDIQKHINVSINIMQGTDFPPNFLYFVAVCVLALFQTSYNYLLFSSLIVISFAVAYKFFLTAKFIAEEIKIDSPFSRNTNYLITNIAGFCLITAFCIYLPKELGLTQYFFLGQIPPNIWHNSTTIFLMPFALLLYWYSAQLLGKFERKKLWYVIGLVIINILIKPSFFLCFIIIFPLLALYKFRLKKEFFLCLVPICIGFGLMILEYIAIYRLGSYGKAGESGVTIAPFEWWRIYTENIPVSLLLSVAFPLIYFIFYFERVKKYLFLYYAYLLFVAGVLFLSLFNETGPRATHGNFQWQAMTCNYILFFAVGLDFIKNVLQKKGLNLKDKIIAIIFILHLFSGWIYLVKVLFRGNYG